MKVAVLHNRKPQQPMPAGVPEDEYEEYDSDQTILAIVGALEGMGVIAQPVIAGRNLPQLLDGRYDFVFNIAEGAGRRCREAVPAAVCELLGLPYTGSDPLTLAVTLDKSIARRIVSPDVPVARAATRMDELPALTYPVIVKPNDEGSSKGIRCNSYCPDLSSAEAQVRRLEDTYGCPVLVEEWLPGAEVTVAIAGPTPLTESTWHLYWLCVHPCFQCRGVARALQSALETAIRAHGGERIVVETGGRADYDPARAFYRAAGYRECGFIPDYYRPGDACFFYCKVLT
jgi:GNAT superfamily N-acetyltransferase